MRACVRGACSIYAAESCCVIDVDTTMSTTTTYVDNDRHIHSDDDHDDDHHDDHDDDYDDCDDDHDNDHDDNHDDHDDHADDHDDDHDGGGGVQ